MRRVVWFVVATCFVLLTDGTALADPFPRPPELEPAIRFWRDIFTKYSRNQVVLHDAYQLDRVYKVLDYRSYADEGWSQGEIDSFKKSDVEFEMQSLRDLFNRLGDMGGVPSGLTEDEQRIFDLFKDDPSPERFYEAAGDKHLHSQSGLKERFQEGLEISRRYLPEMEEIFRDAGLPVELTRLPLIESCFNVRAYSKVGAAGIWQFMPSTGRLFLDVGDRVDERRDPITATRAASEFLTRLYDRLGEWPLAITSYNHGPEGIARAVDAMGTSDIVTIIREYRGPNFGFASRNFYVEFLAAVEVDKNAKTYFPSISFHAPVRTAEVYLPRSMTIDDAARGADLDIDTLASLNPALTPPVADGRLAIPAGYRLRLPMDRGTVFDSWLVAYEAEAAERAERNRLEAIARAERQREEAAMRRAAASAARARSRADRPRVARSAASRSDKRSGARPTVTKLQVNGSKVGKESRPVRGKTGKGRT